MDDNQKSDELRDAWELGWRQPAAKMQRPMDLSTYSLEELGIIQERLLSIQDKIKFSPRKVAVMQNDSLTNILMQFGAIRKPKPTGLEALDALNAYSAEASRRGGIPKDITAVGDEERLKSLQEQLVDVMAPLLLKAKADWEEKKIAKEKERLAQEQQRQMEMLNKKAAFETANAADGVAAPKVINSVVMRIDGEKIFWFDEPLVLQPIPTKILKYLCGHPGKIVTRKNVMTAAGMGEPSKKAFKSHLTAIRTAIKTATKKLPTKNKKNQADKIASALIKCPRGDETVILNLSADQVQIS